MDALPWARPWRRRCTARAEPNPTGYHGRCELAHGHAGDHALDRGMDTPRWSTRWRCDGEAHVFHRLPDPLVAVRQCPCGEFAYRPLSELPPERMTP